MLKQGIAFNQKQPSRLTGDSVLAGILYEETGDGPSSIANLPLDQIGGVMMASQIMLRHPFTVSTKTFIGAGALTRDMLNNHDFTGQFPAKQKFNGNFNKKYTKNPILTVYTVYDASEVWYLMRGDKAKVFSILDRHIRLTGSGRIGSKRNTGNCGVISSFEIEDASQDQKLFGILSHDGRLMRPVPMTSGILPNSVSLAMSGAYETCRCPYHDSALRESCVVPITKTLGFDISDIESFIGSV
jgi:hypothetical protein